SDDKTVKIWDARTGQEAYTLPHGAQVWSVGFSHDGHWLVSTTGDLYTKANGEIKIWNARTGEDVRTLRGHTTRIVHATFSPDGHWLASVGDDGDVRLWDHQLARLGGADRPIRTLDGGRGYGRVVFSHNGQLLALGGGVGSKTLLKVWATNTWGVVVAP